MNLAVGDAYQESGAVVTDFETNLSVSITGFLNTSQAGNYILSYDVTDSSGNKAETAVRTIVVEDSGPPILTLNGSSTVTINLGSAFNDPGATATDEVDGSVPVTRLGTLNVGAVGVYTLTYTASDSAGNKATPVTRTVIVRDHIPPVIGVEGGSPIFLTIGDTYTEPGVTAADNVDTSVSVVTLGTVDTTVAGHEYSLIRRRIWLETAPLLSFGLSLCRNPKIAFLR